MILGSRPLLGNPWRVIGGDTSRARVGGMMAVFYTIDGVLRDTPWTTGPKLVDLQWCNICGCDVRETPGNRPPSYLRAWHFCCSPCALAADSFCAPLDGLRESGAAGSSSLWVTPEPVVGNHGGKSLARARPMVTRTTSSHPRAQWSGPVGPAAGRVLSGLKIVKDLPIRS